MRIPSRNLLRQLVPARPGSRRAERTAVVASHFCSLEAAALGGWRRPPLL
jgi:hypothetical protein